MSPEELFLYCQRHINLKNRLKEEITSDLKKDNRFPTKKPVFVSVVHGLHSKRGFQECDLDNRAKTVLDALKGVVYDDDTQVHKLWTQKTFLKQEEESYYRIAIKILGSTVTTKAILNSIDSS